MAKSKKAETEEKLKAVKITWKEDEKYLHDFAWEHSSPSAWFKDLAKAEYKRQNQDSKPQMNIGMNFLDD